MHVIEFYSVVYHLMSLGLWPLNLSQKTGGALSKPCSGS